MNVGNLDSDGANVNNDSPDNVNGNLGVCLSRMVEQKLKVECLGLLLFLSIHL